MEIKIDYYVRNKETGRTIEIRHITLHDNDILELARAKAQETWSDTDWHEYEPQIDSVIMNN